MKIEGTLIRVINTGNYSSKNRSFIKTGEKQQTIKIFIEFNSKLNSYLLSTNEPDGIHRRFNSIIAAKNFSRSYFGNGIKWKKIMETTKKSELKQIIREIINESSYQLFDPQWLIDTALRNRFITKEEAENKNTKSIAKEVQEQWSEDWPEDQGFSSSDHTFALKSFLEALGKKTDWVNDKLTVIK